VIYAADIGSVATGRFGWASLSDGGTTGGSDPAQMVVELGKDMARGVRVALGFECPLWMDLPSSAAELTKARQGEGNRPWSAGAGAGALATGLVQVTWILRELRRLAPTGRAYLSWAEFEQAETGLYLWEAFVTGEAKAKTHEADAMLAVEAFRRALPNPEEHSAVKPKGTEVLSLVGAAMLRTGWAGSVEVLSRPCLVIRGGAGA
jgi:hypothetical protein